MHNTWEQKQHQHIKAYPPNHDKALEANTKISQYSTKAGAISSGERVENSELQCDDKFTTSNGDDNGDNSGDDDCDGGWFV